MGSGFARELDIGHVCSLFHFNMLSLIIVSRLIDLSHLPVVSHLSSTLVSLLLFIYSSMLMCTVLIFVDLVSPFLRLLLSLSYSNYPSSLADNSDNIEPHSY